MRLFSPRVLRRWQEALIAPICHRQIDRFAASGSADLVAAYADRVAPRVIAALMGMNHDDDRFIEHLEGLFQARFAMRSRLLNPTFDTEFIEAGIAATTELIEILTPHFRALESGEGDDFVSMIWRQAPELFGESWSEINVVGLAGTMWEAGTVTT